MSTGGGSAEVGGHTGGLLVGAGAGGLGGAGNGSTAGSTANGGAGGGAEAATPVRLAAAKFVNDIAVKDGFVYYSDFDDDAGGTSGHVAKISTAGGTPTVLARATPPATAGGIALLTAKAVVVHGSSLYWTESRFDMPPRLAKVSIDGGDIVDVWSDSNCSDILPPLAIDGDDLYWMAGCADTTLLTVSTTGGAARVVASGSGNLWLRPGSAWTPDSDNRSLAVANGFAYWTRNTDPVVSLALSGGTAPAQIGSFFVVSGPSAIVFFGDRLFLTGNDYMLQNKGAVLSLVPGETINTIADKQNVETYSALAVDDTSIYWGVNDSIKSAPRGGGSAATVASSLANPRSFVLDATHIYFVDDTGIFRAPKQAR